MSKEQTGIKTKAKIIIGFGLALIAIVFGSYLTLRSVTSLSSTINDIASPNTKSILLMDIINDLSDAESAVRAYSITKQDHYLRPFYDLLSSIENKMDNIRQISEDDPEDLAKLDTINNLISQKLEILGEYITIEDDEEVEKAMLRIMEMVEKENDQRASTNNNTISRDEEQLLDIQKEAQQRNRKEIEVLQPHEPQKEEKKNVFQKLKNLFTKNKDNEDKQEVEPLPKRDISTIPAPTNQPRERTQPQVSQQQGQGNIKQDIQQVLQDIEFSDSDEEFEFKQDLVMQDRAIMDKIRAIIGRMETKDIQYSEAQAEASIASAQKTIRNIAIFSIVGIIIAIFFIYTLILDITRTYKYRAALQRAKNAAEQNAKAKEEFLANMSHEIRTPLTAIIGFTDQLHYTPLDEDQEKYVEHVQQSSNHLLTIVNDILDFSKLESGNFKLESIPFDPRRIINEVIEVLEPLADKKNITLGHEVDVPMNLMILGDPVRYRQILINLINNAIKFTSDGSVTVICTASDIIENKVLVNTSVRDTGIGIPEDKLGTIFQMFNQADTSISRKFGGTGLGLSISKKLVELQGGTIKVESEEDEGSVFSFEIPFETTTRESFEEEEATEELMVLPKGIKLLLAEDDPFMQQLLMTTLQDLRINADLAENGRIAVEKIHDQKYDLVLMDIQMPEMSGVEAIKKIRSNIKKGIAEMPIIAITANLINGKEVELKALGFDDVIGKPFKKEAIVKTISAILKTKEIEIKSDNNNDDDKDEITLTYLNKEAAGNEDFVKKMVELFQENTTSNLAILKNAVVDKDHAKAGQIAHKMAPSYRHMGLDDLADKLKKVEQLVASNKTNTIKPLADDIIKRTEKVLSLLTDDRSKEKKDKITKTA